MRISTYWKQQILNAYRISGTKVEQISKDTGFSVREIKSVLFPTAPKQTFAVVSRKPLARKTPVVAKDPPKAQDKVKKDEKVKSEKMIAAGKKAYQTRMANLKKKEEPSEEQKMLEKALHIKTFPKEEVPELNRRQRRAHLQKEQAIDPQKVVDKAAEAFVEAAKQEGAVILQGEWDRVVDVLEQTLNALAGVLAFIKNNKTL